MHSRFFAHGRIVEHFQTMSAEIEHGRCECRTLVATWKVKHDVCVQYRVPLQGAVLVFSFSSCVIHLQVLLLFLVF